ncbi:MAG TPA: transcription antitermination factor NusB [Myxococcales bacterium]|nr:transcription antitermination factor NusB [Myxococcales bacterium]
MDVRRKARERAVQVLYQLDGAELRQRSGDALGAVLRAFWASFDPPEPEVQELAEPLISGVLAHLDDLDASVEAASLNWRLSRMARVDRNILRLGAFELRYRPDVPTKVCLNEAIEIARKYGAEDSGAFINGILDRVAQSVRAGEGEAAKPGEAAD